MEEIWDNERIRQARKDAEISTETAKIQLEITQEYLSMLENGHRQPSSKIISRMAKLYARPIAYFLKTDAAIAEM